MKPSVVVAVGLVGDMFNTQLKSKLDAFYTDIAAHLDAPENVGGSCAIRRRR